MAKSALKTIARPLQDFLRMEAAGGLVLMAATVIAMLVANSHAGEAWDAILATTLSVGSDPFLLQKPLLLWINDGLMALFFVVVGLELKREMVAGELSSWQRASLPAVAAVGGMLAPALLYTVFNHGDSFAMRGWAIPTATDIAFALGVLSLLGKRIPPALKAFLLSIAIFDDLGAIVIIAAFYTDHLSLTALGIAVALLVGLFALNRTGVTILTPYIVLGVALWIAVLKSGVHATLAGVMVAMCIPLRVEGGQTDGPSPLLKLEHALHPWVAFGILPLFALANAGVAISSVGSLADLTHPVLLGIVFGLFVGKPVGIMLFCWIAVKARFAALPERVNWRQIFGVALLCGIGFTMSLFIASLAFGGGHGGGHSDAHGGMERVGILLGTLVSGVIGYIALRLTPARH